MAFRPDTPYYPISGSPHPEGTFGTVMEILLKSRLKLKLESNGAGYDEDVNTYIAGVLVSYIDSEYLDAISRVLSKYDMDVFQSALKADTNVEAYRIYKVNADDLLVTLGIFHALWKEERSELGKLKRYYAHAAEYQRRIYGKSTAVGAIQNKLAETPERFLSILSFARSEFLHFLEGIEPDDMAEFNKQISTFSSELTIKTKQDELLDAYSSWLEHPSNPGLAQTLRQRVEELMKLDPSFLGGAILSQLNNSQAA